MLPVLVANSLRSNHLARYGLAIAKRGDRLTSDLLRSGTCTVRIIRYPLTPDFLRRCCFSIAKVSNVLTANPLGCCGLSVAIVRYFLTTDFLRSGRISI